MRIYSFSPFGYEGLLVAVEVDLRRGIPAVDMVGLADGTVRESRERMRAAILNSGFVFPPERLLISLSPADLKKEGAGFDLAIALAVLAGTEKGRPFADVCVLVMGELELSGHIRSVRGVHAAAASAAEQGIRFCIVPEANIQEALSVKGMSVYGASVLTEAFDTLCRITETDAGAICAAHTNGAGDCEDVCFAPVMGMEDYADVAGQEFFIRGLQIAAAGGHNLIAYGPPGCGKTMALKRFPSLMPLLTDEEARPVARIRSLAGLDTESVSALRQAPFRIPHQSASVEGMTGGGPQCRPGEISLAHNGALFLDEAAEFKTPVLQSLRVPLESGAIRLSRAGRSTVYPASFQLLIAANPCPCGSFGAPDRICLCGARTVEQYWKKFSSPLLDRIDLRIPLFGSAAVSVSGEASRAQKTTAVLREGIARAVGIQRRRQRKRNSRLTDGELGVYCPMSRNAQDMLNAVSDTGGISSRGIVSCIKLARTIADMENSDIIRSAHMEEAYAYRKNEGGVSLCF